MTGQVGQREPEQSRGLLSVVGAPPRGGPTVLRIIVGGQLRRLREASGISGEAAGEAIRGSHAKISRIELGRVGFKERDIVDLLNLYGVSDEADRQTVLALARQANAPGWWHRYGEVLPGWFETYLGLEQAASLIRTYQAQFVPGLLQTEDYARAAILLSHYGSSADEIDLRVALRAHRKELLTQPDAPALWAVVDEAALRRPLGGTQAMRAQLEHLLELVKLPNITLQITPLRFGGHAAAGGSFTVLRFPQSDLPDIVYLEQLTSALYLDKKSDLDHYLLVADQLAVQSESPDETVKTLAEMIHEL